MGKMTFVVEFDDGKEPPFQFTDDFMGMGGKLCSVAAFDYKDDLLTEGEVSAVIGTFNENRRDFEVWCDEFDVDLKWSTKTGHRVRVFPVSIFRFVWG